MIHSASPSDERIDVIITGGGTAGHIYPALAVAESLVNSGYSHQRIFFVGSKKGMESRLVPDAGFEVKLLAGRGVVRKVSLESATATMALLWAFASAFVYLLFHRPKVIVTVGGYAGVACAFAGLCLGIPIVVVNIDAVAGASNRLIGRFARWSCVSRSGSGLRNEIVTGAPVRDEVLSVGKSPNELAALKTKYHIDANRKVVLITGGSLGAGRLNDAAVDLARLACKRSDLLIYHVTGERNFEKVRNEADQLVLDDLEYRVVAFEARLYEVCACSDVIICRAGASTVAEITVLGLPSVLVPLPGAPDDHQRVNASELKTAGAALVLEDAQVTGALLESTVLPLLDRPDQLEFMAREASTLARPQAAREIAQLIDTIANRSTRTRPSDIANNAVFPKQGQATK